MENLALPLQFLLYWYQHATLVTRTFTVDRAWIGVFSTSCLSNCIIVELLSMHEAPSCPNDCRLGPCGYRLWCIHRSPASPSFCCWHYVMSQRTVLLSNDKSWWCSLGRILPLAVNYIMQLYFIFDFQTALKIKNAFHPHFMLQKWYPAHLSHSYHTHLMYTTCYIVHVHVLH